MSDYSTDAVDEQCFQRDVVFLPPALSEYVGYVHSASEAKRYADLVEKRTGDTPPSLTGGVQHLKFESCNVDFLTVTIGSEPAEKLLESTVIVQNGRGDKGFCKSDQRERSGFLFWRSYEPYSESEKYGRNYESWSCAGSDSPKFARWLISSGVYCRASRIDLAYDCRCDKKLSAAEVGDLIAAFAVDHRDLKMGGAETRTRDGVVKTVYVGGQTSEKRIRIYRKDLEEPEAVDGPTMRFELVGKKWTARTLWALLAGYREDYREEPKRAWDDCMSVGRSLIQQMSGVVLPGPLREPPEKEPQAVRSVISKVEAALRQCGKTFRALRDRGISIDDLLESTEGDMTRWQKCRRNQVLAGIDAEGVDSIKQYFGMIPAAVPASAGGQEAERREWLTEFYGK